MSETSEEYLRRIQREQQYENDNTGDATTRLINADREHLRRANGDYGPDYERREAEYLREKAESERHAGN